MRHARGLSDEQCFGSGPAVFATPVASPHLIEAIKQVVREQQLRVAASASPLTRPGRGFHNTTIGTGMAELRIGEIPELLQAYLPFHAHDVIKADVRFSYGSERPKQDDGKGMLGLSLRLYFPDHNVWNLTQLSSSVFLKNADEVLLTMQAAKAAAEKYPSESRVRSALAVAFYIVRRAPRGRKWPMLKFGWNATMSRHDSVASTTFFNPTTYALDHPNNGRSYAARFEIYPTISQAEERGPNHALGVDLSNRYAQGPLAYSFGARFYSDEVETPIDDPSVPWPTAFMKLGMLIVSPANKSEHDRIAIQSYNPAQVASRVRSLSTVNTVRGAVYEASQQLRFGDPR